MLYVYLRFARGCSCKRARVSSRSQNGLRGENWERGRSVSAKDNHGITNREANFSSSLKNKVQKSRINTSMTVQLISIRFDYTNSIPFFHHEISFPFLFLPLLPFPISLRSSFFSSFLLKKIVNNLDGSRTRQSLLCASHSTESPSSERMEKIRRKRIVAGQRARCAGNKVGCRFRGEGGGGGGGFTFFQPRHRIDRLIEPTPKRPFSRSLSRLRPPSASSIQRAGQSRWSRARSRAAGKR